MKRFKAIDEKGFSQYAQGKLRTDYGKPGLVSASPIALALGYGLLVYKTKRDAERACGDKIIEIEVRSEDRMSLPKGRLCTGGRNVTLENLLAHPEGENDGYEPYLWPDGTEMYSQIWVIEREEEA